MKRIYIIRPNHNGNWNVNLFKGDTVIDAVAIHDIAYQRIRKTNNASLAFASNLMIGQSFPELAGYSKIFEREYSLDNVQKDLVIMVTFFTRRGVQMIDSIMKKLANEFNCNISSKLLESKTHNKMYMETNTISKLRKLIREEYSKLNEDVQQVIKKEYPGAIVIDATKNKNVTPGLRRKILSLPKREFIGYGTGSASTYFAHVYTFTDTEGKFTFNKNKPVILYIPVNSESKLKVRSEGNIEVTRRLFDLSKSSPLKGNESLKFQQYVRGASINQLKNDLRIMLKASGHGTRQVSSEDQWKRQYIRWSIRAKELGESKLKKEAITGEVIFSVQTKDNSVVKVTELPNGVIYVYKDGQKTNWKAVQGLVNPKDRKEIGDYIMKGK